MRVIDPNPPLDLLGRLGLVNPSRRVVACCSARVSMPRGSSMPHYPVSLTGIPMSDATGNPK